ncbi:sugar phosphate nucleotidyltransferase [Shigella flexneri]
MLPLVNQPLIQYVVNECLAAGITEIVLVTHSSEASIENHFNTSLQLKQCWKNALSASCWRRSACICPPHVTIMCRVGRPGKGLGHAVYARASGSG